MNRVVKIIITVCIIFLIIFLLKGVKNYRIHKILEADYEPKYYINELYKSKEIYYRMLLDEKEKNMYEEIIENFINYKPSFVVSMNNFDYNYDSLYFDKISEITNIIFMDHPELIYIGTFSMSKERGSNIVTIKPNYLMSKDEYTKNIEEIKLIINKVKEETKNLDEYEKVKYVYDYIGKSNTYGNVKDYMGQSAYSAFNKDLSPVCAGYSKASQILFSNIGVNSLLIFGDAEYSLFLGDAHAWNVVEIDKKYYLYDVTMSSNLDGKEFYRGFLIDDKDHKPWNKEASPYLDKKNNNKI